MPVVVSNCESQTPLLLLRKLMSNEHNLKAYLIPTDDAHQVIIVYIRL